MGPRHALRWARQQVGATPAHMASFLGVEEADWTRAETSADELDTRILELCARLLGECR